MLARVRSCVRLANILARKFFLANFALENMLEIFLVLVEVLLRDERSFAIATLMEFLVHKLVDDKRLWTIEIFLANVASESSVLRGGRASSGVDFPWFKLDGGCGFLFFAFCND